MRHPRQTLPLAAMLKALLRLAAGGFLAALLSALAVVALAAPAQADTYRWDQAVVTVRSTAPEGWGVARAVRQWNEHRVENQPRLVLIKSGTKADVVISTVHDTHDDWTGMTTGTATDGTITSIAIALNETAIHQQAYRCDGSLVAAMNWTASHELGHALGLEHTKVERSVMSYSTSWRRTQGLPSSYDFRQLALLYSSRSDARGTASFSIG